MSTNRTGRSQLLRPAVAAARRALQRLDADEVPAALRRIAAHTGGRLPPPLMRKLVEELDGSAWLREKALDEFEADVESADPGQAASSLFLVRPEQWWLAVAALERVESADNSEAEMQRLQAEAESLAARLDESERRLRGMTAERDDAVRQTRDRVDAERKRLADAAGERRSRVAAAEAAAADAAEKIEAERAAHAEVEGIVHRLRADLLKARRERAEAIRRLGEGREASAGRDPRALARAVDELADRARPLLVSSATVPSGADVATRLELPAGVAPDQPAAFDWLAAVEEPFLVLVDGYNVAYQLAPGDATSARARRHVNQELARAAGRFRSSSSVVVVYDSGLVGERTVMAEGRRVEVVFAKAGLLADEEIVHRAAESAVPAVVVSTDREVREQSAAVGALALWSEALVAWLRRPT